MAEVCGGGPAQGLQGSWDGQEGLTGHGTEGGQSLGDTQVPAGVTREAGARTEGMWAQTPWCQGRSWAGSVRE